MIDQRRFKRLLIFIWLCSANALSAQVKIQDCPQYIFIDAVGSAMRLESNPDTVVIKESEVYYLKLLLKSCKGAMYIERHLRSNNNIVFSGNYMDAPKLDTVDAWAVDLMTGNRSPYKATHYKPLRTGVWKFYNDKGELLKEEEYVGGKLISSGN